MAVGGYQLVNSILKKPASKSDSKESSHIPNTPNNLMPPTTFTSNTATATNTNTNTTTTTNASSSKSSKSKSKSKQANQNATQQNNSSKSKPTTSTTTATTVINLVQFYNTQGVLLFKVQIPSIVSVHLFTD